MTQDLRRGLQPAYLCLDIGQLRFGRGSPGTVAVGVDGQQSGDLADAEPGVLAQADQPDPFDGVGSVASASGLAFDVLDKAGTLPVAQRRG